MRAASDGVEEPLRALEALGPRVRSVHLKDARWAERRGVDWGTETCAGEGQVDVEAFMRGLHHCG